MRRGDGAALLACSSKPSSATAPTTSRPTAGVKLLKTATSSLSSGVIKPKHLAGRQMTCSGLAEPPERPSPFYRRLSRHDATGLVRLLRGRQVVALTADAAVIATPNGGRLSFCKSTVGGIR